MKQTSAKQRQIGEKLQRSASEQADHVVKYTYGKVDNVFGGTPPLVPSSLSVIFHEGEDPILGIPFAKDSNIAIGDTVVLLNLGGNYFAVCAVQP